MKKCRFSGSTRNSHKPSTLHFLIWCGFSALLFSLRWSAGNALLLLSYCLYPKGLNKPAGKHHHHRVSCTAPVGALCVEPTRFTSARHLSRSCARGSIAAGSRPSWSRSRLTTSNQRVRGAPRGHFQPKEPGSKSRIAREGWCGGRRSTCSAGKASLQ